jgi:hypothetical protein
LKDTAKTENKLSKKPKQAVDPEFTDGIETSVPFNYNASLPGTPKHLTGFSVSTTPGRLDDQ